jgi:hypothetical protein
MWKLRALLVVVALALVGGGILAPARAVQVRITAFEHTGGVAEGVVADSCCYFHGTGATIFYSLKLTGLITAGDEKFFDTFDIQSPLSFGVGLAGPGSCIINCAVATKLRAGGTQHAPVILQASSSNVAFTCHDGTIQNTYPIGSDLGARYSVSLFCDTYSPGLTLPAIRLHIELRDTGVLEPVTGSGDIAVGDF